MDIIFRETVQGENGRGVLAPGGPATAGNTAAMRTGKSYSLLTLTSASNSRHARMFRNPANPTRSFLKVANLNSFPVMKSMNGFCNNPRNSFNKPKTYCCHIDIKC